jgi:hypothetical protein
MNDQAPQLPSTNDTRQRAEFMGRAVPSVPAVILVGLRDQGPLARVPEDERKACRALGTRVVALLARAGRGIAL